MKLSIVISCYNEEDTLETILLKLINLKINLEKEIIIIDDCSIDRSIEIIKRLQGSYDFIKLIENKPNRGKGFCLRKGFEASSGDIILIQDADLEYDPAEYCKLLQPILDDKADVVYGSRFIGSGAHRVLFYWHYLGNKLLTLCSNMFTNLNLTDMETCYKVFRKDIIKNIRLEEDRF